MLPHTSYFICATHRSGSNLLCEALRNTGLAGRPTEYFYEAYEVTCRKRWDISSYREYLDWVIANGTTPNGVFGAKIMATQFDEFIGRLREVPQYNNGTASRPELLSAIFPNIKYIWVTRRNKVRQAVSLLKASQTGIWAWTQEDPPDATKEPEFNLKNVDRLMQTTAKYEALWQDYFDECGITPFTVIYEDFLRSYAQMVHHILEYLNICVPNTMMIREPTLKKQADALSEKWVHGYYDGRRNERSQYENAYVKLRWEAIGREHKRVALYGAGKYLRYMADLALFNGLGPCVVGLFDGRVRHEFVCGMKVRPAEKMNILPSDVPVVMCTDSWQKSMELRIHELCGDNVKIIDIYDGIETNFIHRKKTTRIGTHKLSS